MGIDHKDLESLAYRVINGNTENSQINTVDLTGNAGKIIIGENNNNQSNKTYSHPDDLAKSYNIEKVFLSKDNKIFENAPTTYSHELVIQMNSTDSNNNKMFIIFFVDPDVQNLSENNTNSDKEFEKLNNNKVGDATMKEIDISLLINDIK